MPDKAGGRYLHKKTDGDGYGLAAPHCKKREKRWDQHATPWISQQCRPGQPSPVRKVPTKIGCAGECMPTDKDGPGLRELSAMRRCKRKNGQLGVVGGGCEGGNDAHRQSRFCGQTCGDSKTCSARYWTPALSRSTKGFLVHHGFPGPKKKIFFSSSFPSPSFSPLALPVEQC